MNFSKLFKSTNAYSGLIIGLFIIIAIIGVFTLMGNSNSNYSSNSSNSSNSITNLSVSQPKTVSNELQMPSSSLPIEQNDYTSFLDNSNSNSTTLEEEVISTMAPTISNENLGNPSYLPVIDSNLDSTDINELN